MPNSPVAPWGAVGVAAPALLPAFHVSATERGFGWYEPIGSDYNTAWFELEPFERTGPYRLFSTPDPLPYVPQLVTFSATNSISGSMSTNGWLGITDFVWDFGDGSRPVWTRSPEVSHTYVVAGALEVKLTVTNNLGHTATVTRKYRLNALEPPGRLRLRR